MKKSLIKERIKNLNHHYIHPSYLMERKLISELKMGLRAQGLETLRVINENDRAILAKDPKRSLKNSIIVSCTLFTRAIIEAGVDSEDAFALSDLFIQHIEEIQPQEELEAFEYEMFEDFIEVILTAKIQNYPNPISKVIRHINNHITTKLSVSELARVVDKTPDYLTRIFKKEVGMTVIDYIHQQKIEVAKYFLEHTPMAVTEISNLLEYSNPAHFSTVFTKIAGTSPIKYRRAADQKQSS
jgi:YesN/AraC family two-component response regulator